MSILVGFGVGLVLGAYSVWRSIKEKVEDEAQIAYLQGINHGRVQGHREARRPGRRNVKVL